MQPCLLLSAAARAALQDRLPALRVVPMEAPGAALREVTAAYISADVMGFSTDPARSASLRACVELLEAAPQLQWLQICSAGADEAYLRALLRRGVRVTTASGANALPVAHSALAAILAFTRDVPQWIASAQARRWTPRWGDPPADLDGSRAVVVGLGPIGREIGRLCRGFGVHVTGIRRSAQPLPECDEVRTAGELAQLLPATDWLVLACPLTDETRGLIDARMLAALPPRARLINVSRGGVVDEAALCAALEAGRLAGAYSDVFAQEPLPPQSPLWTAPNMLLSSHSAGAGRGVRARIDRLFLANVDRWLGGTPLLNAVAPPGGA